MKSLVQLLFFCFLMLTTCTTLLAQVLPYPPPVKCDLNGDSFEDSIISLGACTRSNAPLCVIIQSLVTPYAEFNFFPPGARPRNAGYIPGESIKCIGNHSGSALSEIAVVYTLPYAAKGCDANEIDRCQYPAIAVVDPVQGLIASTWGPAGNSRAFVAYPSDLSGRRYPMLIPGYGNMRPRTGDPKQEPFWDFLCRYDPYMAPYSADPRCSSGFRSITLNPVLPDGSNLSEIFREYGGYLQDINNDGWEDVNLIFHKYLVSVSGRTGDYIESTFLNFSEGQDPPALLKYQQENNFEPGYYHSHRLYGKYMSIPKYESGAERIQTLVIGGVSVGDASFSDPGCNGSRFITLLEAYSGSPGSRHMKYHTYYNWGAGEYPHPRDPLKVSNPPVLHHGGLNKCIHMPSDSRSKMNGKRVAIFNIFNQFSATDPCYKEGYEIGIPPDTDGAKAKRLNDCLPKRTYENGRWQAKIIDEESGAEISSTDNLYIWGMGKNFVPGNSTYYVGEALPLSVPYDIRRSNNSWGRQALYSLNNGLFSRIYVFPVTGRPQITYVEPRDNKGTGAAASFGELTLSDIDGDGLQDIKLSNGNHVGYSQYTKNLAVKNNIPTTIPPQATITHSPTATSTPTSYATRRPSLTPLTIATSTVIPRATLSPGSTFNPSAPPSPAPTAAPISTISVLKSSWRNPKNYLDVNGNGRLNASDVSLVIKKVNSGGPHKLPVVSGNNAPPPYYDVNGDEMLTIADANTFIDSILYMRPKELTAFLANSKSTAMTRTQIKRLKSRLKRIQLKNRL